MLQESSAKLPIRKTENPQPQENFKMSEDTRRRIINVLNDYIKGVPEFTNVEFKDVMEHADKIIRGIPELAKLHEDTRPRELVFAYKNLYKQMPHSNDWDPTGKTDEEIIELLIKRFGMKEDN